MQLAIERHDEPLLRQRAVAGTDHRSMAVELDRVRLDGLVPVGGLVELPDAVALDAALAHGASELAALGCTDPVGARRARAVGDLAREHLSLWEQPAPPRTVVVDTATGQVTAGRSDVTAAESEPVRALAEDRHDRPMAGRRRQVVLHVHLDAAALTSPMVAPGDASPTTPAASDERDGEPGAWVEGRVGPVTAESVRRWCGAVGTTVTVMPVLDLAAPLTSRGYEPSDRLRELVVARDGTCVFPSCSHPARSCDLDHIVPYDHERPTLGGATDFSNLAALCRHHHRLKTAGRIAYRRLGPGTYEWTFPTGMRVLRDGHRRVARTAPARERPSAPVPRHGEGIAVAGTPLRRPPDT